MNNKAEKNVSNAFTKCTELLQAIFEMKRSHTSLRIRDYLDNAYYQTQLKLNGEQKARITLSPLRGLPE